ncbi:MAG: MBOAT family O-acyltransferase [Planctomycetota bacterium]
MINSWILCYICTPDRSLPGQEQPKGQLLVFTSFDYLIFLSAVFVAYWLLRRKSRQNLLLLICSYIFYGYIHPWFCILIAVSTLVDYFAGLGMGRFASKKRIFLIISLICNLGMLGFFKYFNFFTQNIYTLFENIGVKLHPMTLRIFLPVGISFYTFQTLSYTIDVYRGKIPVRRNFIDFALFVAFFPQLVAGPIERASRLLPQIEKHRHWLWQMFLSAWPLLIRGYLKKVVIADNIAVYADKIYMLEQPTFFLLTAGTLAFALQIYADFSAYTDIARGSARLLGFDLMENFKSPYLAVCPSDFWRRWHISFSSWIRDYLYISLGGSRVNRQWKFAMVLLASLGLSGLWHGAAWNFIAWGIYHAALVFAYHRFGITGKWQPESKTKLVFAWLAMLCFTMIGWAIFRAANLGWLANIFTTGFSFGASGDSLIVALVITVFVMFYSLPLMVMMYMDRVIPQQRNLHALIYGLALVVIILFFREGHQDFIYFQF